MGVRLIQGDCLQEMGSIDDGSVDLILCDLPYGATACKWDTVIPFPALWSHYKRLVKRNGAIVLTASQPFTSLLVCSNLEWFKYCWVWVKSRPVGFLNANRRPLRVTEDIAVFASGDNLYNPQGIAFCGKRQKNSLSKRNRHMSKGIASHDGGRLTGQFVQEFTNYPDNVLPFASEERALHPTQKPVSLLTYLVLTYTNEGETVLDNCMGSGTTGVACIQTNRNFIGIERDENYFCIASKRIADAEAQTLLAFPTAEADR